MRACKRLRHFVLSEDGAVTVDWVVLTAAIVGLGISVIASVNSGSNSVASGIEESLTNVTVNSLGSLGSFN